MNHPTQQVNLTDNPYFILLKNHKGKIIRTIVICVALALASYFVLPRKYKVSTSISLQSQYFQLPMVSGFMPENNDSAEMKAKREAIINLALNQQFLVQIARRYELIKDAKKILPNNAEMAQLRKRFEVIPTSASAFTVSFTGKDATQSYQVLQDFLAHLQIVMINERHTLLLNLHDAIQEQLEAMSIGKMGEGSHAILASRPDLVQRRMDRIKEEIDTLKNSFSERHPRIASLKEQLASLSAIAKPIVDETQNPNTPRGDIFAGVRVDENQKELFDDLMKKYRYLEVVLFMDRQNKDHYMSFLSEPFIPDSPVFPKLPLLFAWGLVGGFLIGAGRVILKERKRLPPRLPIASVNELVDRVIPHAQPGLHREPTVHRAEEKQV